ncbi:NAD-dependent epimerase/dehydratase family protein [Prosthecodimorpha staleyi]|uniref:NAD-dependent epimerase/dehydratase family protein n=1 Tax=Prosthecodimorpha staleyi TaxID=2840188 RepID=A0A947D3Q2_9HYPH|nr:NAD-dependent epimerase/dehydratase family protein [Prosthecodimorpha staleyi]MBT9290200.1 NAD-dependent epimerase/dehydratase family protein [Prosthecodimorpha staleyi]
MPTGRPPARDNPAAGITGRVALVGCNGFIGRAVTRLLGPVLGERLTLVNRSELGPVFERWAPSALRAVADLAEPDRVAAACGDAETVVDLVADGTPASVHGLDLRRIHHLTALRCDFHAALAARPGRHLILTSSGGAVYGEAGATPVSESRAERPAAPYGLLKLSIEQGLAHVGRATGLTWTTLRIANPYGPGQQVRRGQGVVAALVQASLNDIPFQLRGDGGEVRDFVHVADVAEAIALAVRVGRDLAGEIINIGSGTGRRIGDLIRLVEEAGRRPIRIETMPQMPGEIRSNILDIGKAGRLLGWQPHRSLERTIHLLLTEPTGATAEAADDPPTAEDVAQVRMPSFPSAQAKAPPKGPLWFFLHIPKTAGSSLRSELAGGLAPNANVTVAQSDSGRTFEIRRDAAFDRFLAEHAVRPLRFASGHMRWRQVRRLPAQDPQARLATMLRDPVTRVVSAYRYMRTPMHPPHEDFIREFPRIEDFIEHSAHRNYMAMFLSEYDDEPASSIADRLESTFAFVGLYEDYSLSRAVLLKLAGVTAAEERHVRKTPDLPVNEVTPSADLERRIRARNERDCEIHALWRDRHERRRAEWVAFLAAPSDARAQMEIVGGTLP